MPNDVLLQTDLVSLKFVRRGKIRDIYDLGENLLLVATDRLSAFDVVLSDGIPGRGKILNQLSIMWFILTGDIIPNHLVTANFEEFPQECQKYPELEGRSMIVQKARPLPVECIPRGYLSGSAWKEYRKTGIVCGIKLPEGLIESSLIPGSIFTASTKAEEGHDVNITFEEMVEILKSRELAERIRRDTVAVYNRGIRYAEDRGIIIPDTKFEFGFSEKGYLMLIDELLTPDSSRFWSLKNYKPGGSQDSYDKQPIRDFLIGEGWKGAENGPAPELPEWLIKQTSERYQEILEMLQP